MRSMTIAIPSYQRRESLVLMLRELATQLADAPVLAEGLDIVVVIDGSTDGSLEAVRALEMPVPLTCRWHENRGRAATRNACLQLAQGDVVWFLDDDLRPGQGLIRRHRAEHENVLDHLLLGPCWPDPVSVAGESWFRWWRRHLDELATRGVVDRFDRFTVANLSGPRAIFSAVGGFDESFRDYGMEDHELGYRLLSAGFTVRFDPEAVAWHEHEEGEPMEIRRERTVARNTVLLARRHPDAVPVLFPAGDPGLGSRLLAHTGIRSAVALRVVSHIAAWFGLTFGHALPWRVRNLVLNVAHSASYASGIAETAPELVHAVLLGEPAARLGEPPAHCGTDAERRRD